MNEPTKDGEGTAPADAAGLDADGPDGSEQVDEAASVEPAPEEEPGDSTQLVERTTADEEAGDDGSDLESADVEGLATEAEDPGLEDLTLASAAARPDELAVTVEEATAATPVGGTKPAAISETRATAAQTSRSEGSDGWGSGRASQGKAGRWYQRGFGAAAKRPLLTAGVLLLWAGALVGGTLLGGRLRDDDTTSGGDEGPAVVTDDGSSSTTTERTTSTSTEPGVVSETPATSLDEGEHDSKPTTTTSSSTTTSTSTTSSTTTTTERAITTTTEEPDPPTTEPPPEDTRLSRP